MDPIKNGATIRIGFKDHYDRENSFKVNFSVPTYSLKINKKSVLISDCAGASNDYLRIYEEVAKEIAGIMGERNVKNYVLYNGEMIDMWSKKWESCGCIPKDGEKLFRKTLENNLQ